MKAAVMEEFGKPLKIEENRSDPECGPRDVVIEVGACGICRSDHTLWSGGFEWMGIVPPLPTILGHEYCGVVIEVGREVRGCRVGDRIVAPFCQACGSCETCRSGHQNVCSDLQLPGFHFTGGFASHSTVANANVNVVKLPDAISFTDAAGMGCRFVTAYHGLVDQAAVKEGEWVAVFACGGVGLSAVNIAAGLGAQVVAVSRSPEKLDLARSLGAAHTVTAGPDAANEVVELTGGGAHVSVDALGSASTAIPAILSLRARGRHLRLGVSNKSEQGRIDVPVDVVTFRELSIIGSFGMQAARYPEMLGMVESGALSPGRLVGETVALEDVSDVLTSMSDYETVGMPVITSF
jgi:alcohol dehydrogenase/propanol-preferring alcohol dehydrogenase